MLQQNLTCHKNLQNQCLQVPQDQRESWWRQGGCLKVAGCKRDIIHKWFLNQWKRNLARNSSSSSVQTRLASTTSGRFLGHNRFCSNWIRYKWEIGQSRDLLKKLVSRRGGKLPWRYSCLCTVERLLCKACSWENLEKEDAPSWPLSISILS